MGEIACEGGIARTHTFIEDHFHSCLVQHGSRFELHIVSISVHWRLIVQPFVDDGNLGLGQ